MSKKNRTKKSSKAKAKSPTERRYDLLRHWLRALRSGKYRQGAGALLSTDGHRHKKFCCLGVACDVMKIDHALISGKDFPDPDEMLEVGLASETGEFDAPEKWLNKMRRSNKALARKIEGSLVYTLADLNDSGNFSFKEIAQIIEMNPPGLLLSGVARLLDRN